MKQQKKNEKWKVWDNNKSYGEVLFKRAVGDSPEMESSKAAANQLKDIIKEGDSILDIGCGAGHYLVSLRKRIHSNFDYMGIDATASYVELAKKAFHGEKNVDFQQGDIFNLPLEDNSKDVVMCCNVFLHLSSIKKPLSELCRVARRFVLIRTLIGNRSFRIMDVHKREGNDFEDNGKPKSFHYYNIYSQDYIKYLLLNMGIKNVQIVDDTEFKPKNINKAIGEQPNAPSVTRMLDKWQVNGYILEPWSFIKIDLTKNTKNV